MSQRIQFLEAKGLTGPEIDVAVKQASALNQTAQQAHLAPYVPVYSEPPYPRHSWDWRDYFITSVITGSIAYGAVALFKKYLLPHLQPPTSSVYEADRDALNAQFDVAEALLKEIQSQTEAVRTAVEEQKEKIDKITQDVESVVSEVREGEVRFKDELKEVREEVDNVRDMLPKMLEKNKETQSQSLAELQQEMKSLKALLLSRGPTASVSPLPSFSGRPSIPAWQLATGNSNTPTASWDRATTSGLDMDGKGKEVNTDVNDS